MVGEDDFVEFGLPGDLADRIHLDARLLHLDQKLRQAVTAVFLGRLRGAEDRDHVVGDVRRRGPDLGAVDEIAAVGLGGARLGREQVRAGVRFAHADGKADFAAADARQDIHLDVLGGVFDQHRTALAIGDEEAPGRRVGDAHLLGHHIALEEGAFLAAIFLRPGHAEPALGADPAGEFRRVGVFAVRLVRIEGAGGDFLGEEGAHFLAQLLALFRQTDRIETKGCGHSRVSSRLISARPPAATIHRRRGWRPACRVRRPSSFPSRNRRARPAPAAKTGAGCARW